MKDIILYTTNCPKCKILVSKLNQKNINFIECHDIEIMKKLGFETVPMLKVDEKILDFGQAIKYLNSLEE